MDYDKFKICKLYNIYEKQENIFKILKNNNYGEFLKDITIRKYFFILSEEILRNIKINDISKSRKEGYLKLEQE